jgi:hypothetical protein
MCVKGMPKPGVDKFRHYYYYGSRVRFNPTTMDFICRRQDDETIGYICFKHRQKGLGLGAIVRNVTLADVRKAISGGGFTTEGALSGVSEAKAAPTLPPLPDDLPPGVSLEALKARHRYYHERMNDVVSVIAACSPNVPDTKRFYEEGYRRFLATGIGWDPARLLIADIWHVDQPQEARSSQPGDTLPGWRREASLTRPFGEQAFLQSPPRCSPLPSAMTRVASSQSPSVAEAPHPQRDHESPTQAAEAEPIVVPASTVVISAPTERKKSRSPRNARRWRMDVRLYRGSVDVVDRLVAEEFSDDVYYKKRGPHWDGYDRHSCVVFPCFSSLARHKMTIQDVEEICDSAPYDVCDSEGKDIPFLAKVIIFAVRGDLNEIEEGRYHARFVRLLTSIKDLEAENERGERNEWSGATRATTEGRGEGENAPERRDSGGREVDMITTAVDEASLGVPTTRED